MRALLFGQAQYIATERGYVLMNASMVVLYGLYAKSHLYQGMELLVYLVLFHLNTQLPVSFLYSWSVWMFALCVVIAPWWFSPQATNLFWMRHSWLDWRRWIDGNFNQPRVSHGSWASWHAHMMANWRNALPVVQGADRLHVRRRSDHPHARVRREPQQRSADPRRRAAAPVRSQRGSHGGRGLVHDGRRGDLLPRDALRDPRARPLVGLSRAALEAERVQGLGQPAGRDGARLGPRASSPTTRASTRSRTRREPSS